jgi:ferredoxin
MTFVSDPLNAVKIGHGKNLLKVFLLKSWGDRVPMKKVPAIDLAECTDCEACLELCPHIFKRNEETGQIEVVDLSEYPEKEVQEAISMCPAECITWEEVP